VLAVGHDLVFNGEVLLPNLPRTALLAQRINALPTRAATRGIAVHFLPTTSRDPRIRVARPESTASGEALEDRAAPVVCYFRDQNGLEIARRLARAGRDVLLFGDTAQDEPKIRVQPFCKDGFRRALLGSSAVVASAGSNLLAECVALHKPVLAVYRRYDSEQMLNALLAQHAEVGVACELGKASDTVMRFISRVERGDFARVDLENELPPLSQVVGATLSELQGSGKGSPAPALDEPGAVKASPTTGH
jgi:UDP-N-acetylglucosamine--N-acetylmuramyl-(pentapeptide) pyrophosphoryl-undecaprenol N-acetylglucosamine transferase